MLNTIFAIVYKYITNGREVEIARDERELIIKFSCTREYTCTWSWLNFCSHCSLNSKRVTSELSKFVPSVLCLENREPSKYLLVAVCLSRGIPSCSNQYPNHVRVHQEEVANLVESCMHVSLLLLHQRVYPTCRFFKSRSSKEQQFQVVINQARKIMKVCSLCISVGWNIGSEISYFFLSDCFSLCVKSPGARTKWKFCYYRITIIHSEKPKYSCRSRKFSWFIVEVKRELFSSKNVKIKFKKKKVFIIKRVTQMTEIWLKGIVKMQNQISLTLTDDS